MPELRWDAILGEWVMLAPARQERPLATKGAKAACPFCCPPLPKYDVRIYPNDFPSLTPKPESRTPNPASARLFQRASSYGFCDVVLYSPKHDLTFAELPLTQVQNIVALWQARYKELAADPRIRYIQIFENKGATIGVTIPHPHGQIYAFPYVPPRIQRKWESALAYVKRRGGKEKSGAAEAAPYKRPEGDLWGDMLKAELRAKKRIVAQGEHFVAYVPFAAHWPYELHVVPRRPLSGITELFDLSDRTNRTDRTDSPVAEFAAILKTVAMKYDNLFGFSFPYMMTLYNAPVNTTLGREMGTGSVSARCLSPFPNAWRFHVEFYPPFRAADKLKFRAGVETGAGSFINDVLPEVTAAKLRAAKPTLAQVLAGARHRHFPPPPPGFAP